MVRNVYVGVGWGKGRDVCADYLCFLSRLSLLWVRKGFSVVWLVLLQPLIWVGSGEQLFEDSGLRDCGAPSREDAATSGQWVSQ